MPWLLVGLAILAGVIALLYALAYSNPRDIRRIGLWALAFVGVGVIILLLLSGRAGLIWMGFVFFAPLLRRILMAGRLWRFRRHFMGNGGGAGRQNPAGRGKMSRAEALEILGLRDGASREEIISAHRRMMKRAHPDKGGSARMAALLNEARDILLS